MLDVLEVKKQLAMHSRKLHCVCALVVLGVRHAAAASVLPAHGQHAMVASQSELASQAGVDVMKQGGNAVDAAVAVGFALAVVHPLAGNIGGGGFMLFRAANGDTHFLDYREKAPAKATATMYLDQNGKYIPNSGTVGYKAIAVPGSVAGLVYAQKHWGKLTLQQVMSPAIKLARDGWALSYEYTQFFRGGWGVHLSEFPESRRIFQSDGNFYQPGEILRQPELARTLERIAQNPDDFYHGQIARELAAAIQKGGGLISAEDLAAYEAKERQPVQGTYRGLEIISAPPPSSGGVALIEALNILEGYDLAKAGNRSAESIHLVTEAFRRAFFDRAQLMGDPDFTKVPVAQLIDKKYGVAWRESIQPHEATLSAALHRPSQFSALDRIAEAMGAPATVPEPDHTTHYSVVDPDGKRRRCHHHAERRLRFRSHSRTPWFSVKRRDGRLRRWPRHSQPAPARSWPRELRWTG